MYARARVCACADCISAALVSSLVAAPPSPPLSLSLTHTHTHTFRLSFTFSFMHIRTMLHSRNVVHNNIIGGHHARGANLCQPWRELNPVEGRVASAASKALLQVHGSLRCQRRHSQFNFPPDPSPHLTHRHFVDLWASCKVGGQLATSARHYR